MSVSETAVHWAMILGLILKHCDYWKVLGMMKFKNARGFSLIETGVMLAVVSLVGMVAAPAVQESRSKMRGVSSSANLQQIGQGAASYGFSNNGRLFSYTWRAGETYVLPSGQIRTASSDYKAASNQNEEILMRRTGRVSRREKIQAFPNHIVHLRYNHIVLFDFLNESEKSTKFIDPNDHKLMGWHANPLEYLEDENALPFGNVGDDYSEYEGNWLWGESAVKQRWAFGTSYQTVPAAWAPDFPEATYRPYEFTQNIVVSGGSIIPLAAGRNISEVKHTGQKVWMHEEFDREQMGDPNFSYDFAQTEKLMFDLSVNNWSSGSANSSRVEHYGLGVWRQRYVSLHQFPDPITGLGEQTLLDQRFRWTYRGLGGVDYGLAQPGRKPMRYTR